MPFTKTSSSFFMMQLLNIIHMHLKKWVKLLLQWTLEDQCVIYDPSIKAHSTRNGEKQKNQISFNLKSQHTISELGVVFCNSSILQRN
jgi:hypothetical protein